MNNGNLKGRRYVNLVRCSSDQQADTSPVDQQGVLNEFGRDCGMIHAGGDVILEGVSGSLPGARDDIDVVIERKKQRDDFDVLLVQDVSRLTRGGGDHTGFLKHRLATVGVEVVFVASGTTGDPDVDSVLHSMGGYAAKQQVKSMSYAIVRGQMSSFAAGNIPHTYRIPYGIDRLYLGMTDGRPRHRVRNLTDGTQQMLAVDDDTVIAQYGRNPKKGGTLHYRRQSDERVVLIPGAPEQVRAVRQMYRRLLVDGWGSHRIASELNEAGLPAANGGRWTTNSIDKILENSTYTGMGIAGRFACGIFHVHGLEAAPQAVKRDVKAQSTRRSASATPRPEADWRRQDHPGLADYLGDPDLRQRGIEYHAKIAAKAAAKLKAPAAVGKPGGDRHVDSPYVLKGLLHCLQGGYVMSGKVAGPKGYRRRYYKVTRGDSAPQRGSTLGKLVPAEPLEIAVVSAVKAVLLDRVNLLDCVTRAVGREQASLAADRSALAPLLAERDEIGEKLRDALTLGPSSRKLMMEQFDRWETRLTALEGRIALAETASTPTAPVDVNAIVEVVGERLRGMAESLGTLPPVAVRELLASVVAKLTVDLETREVQMELMLPTTLGSGGSMDGGLCLVGTTSLAPANEAQRRNRPALGFVHCGDIERRRCKPPCFVCTRRAA